MSSGTLTLLILGVVLALIVIAVAREQVVRLLWWVARLIGVILEAIIDFIIKLVAWGIDAVKKGVPHLRDLHRAYDAPYGRIWDFLIPILFLGFTVALVFADFMLFAIRITGILRFQDVQSSLGIDLTIPVALSFVVTAVVLTWAFFDSRGHSPTGQSVMGFNRIAGGEVDVEGSHAAPGWVSAVLGFFCVVILAAAVVLTIWTIVKLQGTDDAFWSGLFLVLFLASALVATVISTPMGVVGLFALILLVAMALTAALWVLGGLLWLVLRTVDVLINVVVAVIDLFAAQPAKLYYRFSKDDRPAEKHLAPISKYRQANPLLQEQLSVHDASLDWHSPQPFLEDIPTLVEVRPALPTNGNGHIEDMGGIEMPVAEREAREPVPVTAGTETMESGGDAASAPAQESQDGVQRETEVPGPGTVPLSGRARSGQVGGTGSRNPFKGIFSNGRRTE